MVNIENVGYNTQALIFTINMTGTNLHTSTCNICGLYNTYLNIICKAQDIQSIKTVKVKVKA
jgi:hypothetical protein